MRLRRAPVLAGVGFAGILLCALVPEAVAAWMAPLLVVALAAVSMAMRPADDAAGSDGGGADGRDGDQGGDQGGGEGAGDAGGDGGGDGGGE